MRRRQLLKAIPASIGVTSIRGVSARPGKTVPRYEGTRVHRIREFKGEYRHEEWFVQKRGQLERDYGQTEVKLDDHSVDTEAYRIIRERIWDIVDKTRASSRELDAGGFEVAYEDTAIIDSLKRFSEEEQRQKKEIEEQLRGSTTSLDGTSSVGAQNHGVQIDFPIHVYKADNPDDVFDLGERTGPINIGWDTYHNASEVADTTDWSTIWAFFSGDRCVIHDAPSVKSEDDEVGENIAPFDAPVQWHVRLYDVPSETVSVVGQAHKDPVDHGQIFDPDDWDFRQARRTLKSASPWNEFPYQSHDSYIGNELYYEGHTCDGIFTRIS